jgi:hypothetical protein
MAGRGLENEAGRLPSFRVSADSAGFKVVCFHTHLQVQILKDLHEQNVLRAGEFCDAASDVNSLDTHGSLVILRSGWVRFVKSVEICKSMLRTIQKPAISGESEVPAGAVFYGIIITDGSRRLRRFGARRRCYTPLAKRDRSFFA